MRIFLATNNKAKVARLKRLLGRLGFEGVTPGDLGIEVIEVEEGSDIAKNATMKALAYRTLTDLPILANDASFTLDGEGLDPAKVKRNALGGRDEVDMSQAEIAKAIIAFYRGLVERRGENIPCQWEDCFALCFPDGTTRTESGIRPVLLTGEVVGDVHPYFPMRSMYIVGPTGKYVAEQTEQDELLELKPLTDALRRLLLVD